MGFDDEQQSLGLDRMALALPNQESDPEVLAPACLAHVTRNASPGAFGSPNDAVAAPLIALGDRHLFTCAEQAGIQQLDKTTSVCECLRTLPS